MGALMEALAKEQWKADKLLHNLKGIVDRKEFDKLVKDNNGDFEKVATQLFKKVEDMKKEILKIAEGLDREDEAIPLIRLIERSFFDAQIIDKSRKGETPPTKEAIKAMAIKHELKIHKISAWE